MLILSVVVYLENHDLDEFTRPDGARFHKWLPNGRDDAVVVPVTDARNSLELWFERRGYVQDAFIRYDPGRFEVDTDVMRRQGYLDSGVLFAEARFAHATASELTAVRNNARDSDDYVSVGKRVVQFLQPPLSAFLDLLKTRYGQYWIRDLQPWDSRRESLSSYCSNLELRWRETPNDPWRDFRPTELIVNFVASAALPERLAEYLTEADWRTIQSSFDPASEQPLASRQFVRAQELMDGGHLAEAVIQAVTGSELAIEYFARSRGVDTVAAQQFFDLPIKVQLAILAAGLVAPTTLNKAVQAIELRNEIVHKGIRPERDPTESLVRELTKCGQALLGTSRFKTPELNLGNRLSPA